MLAEVNSVTSPCDCCVTHGVVSPPGVPTKELFSPGTKPSLLCLLWGLFCSQREAVPCEALIAPPMKAQKSHLMAPEVTVQILICLQITVIADNPAAMGNEDL